MWPWEVVGVTSSVGVWPGVVAGEWLEIPRVGVDALAMGVRWKGGNDAGSLG